MLDESLTDEGLSAHKGEHTERGALGGFLDSVRAGRITRGTFLIVEHWDRLSRRDVRIALAQFLMIIDAGIRIVTLFDGRVYQDKSESVEMDLITAILHMSEAYKSSKRKVDLALKTWILKRNRLAHNELLTTTRPAWLDITANGRSFVPNAGAKTVKRIFREAAAGLGTFVIATGLNRDRIASLTGDKKHATLLPSGEPNPHPLAGKTKGGLWNPQRVSALIKSDAPLGWFQPHTREGYKRTPAGAPIKDYYPAVIDQLTADRARAALAGRSFGDKGAGRKGTVISNLFSGVAVCQTCGGNMYLANKDPKRNLPGKLRCTRSVADVSQCSNRAGVMYGKLEAAFIRDYPVIHSIVSQSPDHSDSSAVIEGAIADKQAEAGKLKGRIAEMTADFDTPYAVLREQLKAMSERHSLLTGEIETMQNQLKLEKATNRNLSEREREFIVERMQSPDPDVVRKARAEMALAIKNMLKVPLICRTDCTVTLSVKVLPHISVAPEMNLCDGIQMEIRYKPDFDGVVSVDILPDGREEIHPGITWSDWRKVVEFYGTGHFDDKWTKEDAAKWAREDAARRAKR